MKLGMIQAVCNFAQLAKAIERMIDRSPQDFTLDDALRLETSAARIRETLTENQKSS
jgi:hypothetical protein